MRRMAAQGNPCVFGHRPRCLLQKCDALYSFLCLERENPRPCEQYQGRPGAWFVPQGCPGDARMCNSEKIYGNAAVVRRQVPEEMPAAGQPQATPVRANINADDLLAATLAILIHDWRGILAIPKRS